MLDEGEFLVRLRGARAVALPRDQPYELDLDGTRLRSTTSRASPQAACSAATPTGAGRCGCRSTSCWSRRCRTRFHHYGDDFKVECPTGSGRPRCGRWPTSCAAGWSASSRATPTGVGRCSATLEIQTDPHWRDLSPSTSTSTATPAPASAPPTRPAGRPGREADRPALGGAGVGLGRLQRNHECRQACRDAGRRQTRLSARNRTDTCL